MEAVPSVTTLLKQWRSGDDDALQQLTPMIYDDLRRIASRHLRSERRGHTLQATALVNEAFLRLADAEIPWQNRAHFFAVAARLMRRILTDYGRARNSQKRQAMGAAITLNEEIVSTDIPSRIVDLNNALETLEKIDQRKSDILVLHYFGGMTYAETAVVLGISDATVARDLEFSKSWLRRELQDE